MQSIPTRGAAKEGKVINEPATIKKLNMKHNMQFKSDFVFHFHKRNLKL